MRGSWEPKRTATYRPPFLWPKQRFFPVPQGCSTGGLGAQPPWVLVLYTASYPQLVWSPTATAQSGAWGPTLLGAGFLYRILSPTDWTFCAPSYIIVRRTLSSCGRHKSHSFNPSTVKVIFCYSSTGCTTYLLRCISFFDCPAGSEVNIQHTHTHTHTHIYIYIYTHYRATPLFIF